MYRIWDFHYQFPFGGYKGVAWHNMKNKKILLIFSMVMINAIGASVANAYTCSVGYYLPAGADSCVQCPTNATCAGGTYDFNTTQSQGIVINNVINDDLGNACSTDYVFTGGTQSALDWHAVFERSDYNVNLLTTNNYANECNVAERNGLMTSEYGLNAVYEINKYMCAAGYFLPANTEGCQTCPDGATCAGRTNVGGEYIFDPENSQGIVINDRIHTGLAKACSASYVFANGTETNLTWTALFEIAGYDINLLTPSNNTGACDIVYSNGLAKSEITLRALYQINEYTCVAGQYLPANSDVCATCTANSYCVGGTYTYNASTAQGIVACDSGLTSPAGSSSASDCAAVSQCEAGYHYVAGNPASCQANTINIDWKDASGDTFEFGSCTYDGALTTPTTAPTKRGYTFGGWKFILQN